MRDRTVWVVLLVSFCFLLGFPYPVAAQTPLTLREAVAIALEENPERRAAQAEQRAASAGIGEARADLLPHLTFYESATRGNDPVYAFGTKLRQQRFDQLDFALERLNAPTPVNNFATRFEATWNLFDTRRSWLGLERAEQLEEAAGRRLERTEQELVFRVTESYFGLLLALKEKQVAEEAVQTARANLNRTQDRYEAGLAVQSDLLSARVHLAATDQELIRAANGVEIARVRLNHELGVEAGSVFEPVEVLAERPLPLGAMEVLEAQALDHRPDLGNLRLQEAAQQTSLRMARAEFGPRVNLVAAWEADNPSFLGNGGTNWLGAIEVQFDIFQGGSRRARLAREQALHNRIGSLRELLESAVRLEVRRAYLEQDAARRQVDVVRAAVDEAQESLRIIQDRYETGLTTITDLLRAEETVTRTRTRYWEAVYRRQTSYAALELAAGTLNIDSPVVQP